MNKLLVSLSAISLVLTAPAFAEKETYKSETKVEKDEKGNYEAKSTATSTDAAGTTEKREVKTDVDVDRDGSKETTIKTKTIHDPKGLMNKNTVATEQKIKEKDGVVEKTYEKKVDGKKVEEEKTVQ